MPTKKTATSGAKRKIVKKSTKVTNPTVDKTPKRRVEPFMSPLKPSLALSVIVGVEPLPRTEIVKRVWNYIQDHNLQDPNNKKFIRADENLKKIFNGKMSVSMFEMTKLIAEHLKA
jgi:upstream activation factor subunit UAF30